MVLVARWHVVFELQQELYELRAMLKKRIKVWKREE